MPVSGAWRLSNSLFSSVGTGEANSATLFINGNLLSQAYHSTYNGNSDTVLSTGGRMVTVQASAGDSIEIRATRMDHHFGQVQFCAEFIPKI